MQDPVSGQDAQDIMMDSANPLAAKLVPLILRLDWRTGSWRTPSRSWRTGRTRATRTAVDSPGAAYFAMVFAALLEATFTDELPAVGRTDSGLPLDAGDDGSSRRSPERVVG